MPDICFIDKETRSAIDLGLCGVDVYSKHHTTDVVCMAYAFNKETEVAIWKFGEPLPARLSLHVQKGGLISAHNTPFEFNLWNNCAVPKYGWPTLRIEQCEDSMAMGNAMGLPGTLDMASRAAAIEFEKDMEGHRIMLQLSQPKRDNNGTIEFWEYNELPEKFERLFTYCKQDVIVQRALRFKLNPLSEFERRLWILDQKINKRGVGIDLKLARKMATLVAREQDKLKIRLDELTGKRVPSFNSHVAFKRWVNEKGFATKSIDKDAVTRLLKRKDLTDEVREALTIRKYAAKSSNAKLTAMLHGCTGGRARYTFEYYGAKQTGRWAGRRLQLHNMPRSKMKFKDIEDILTRLDRPDEIEMVYGPIMQVMSECLRALLVPAPGYKFFAGDFSNIEGRVLAWLAGEEWKLQAFRNFDADPVSNPDLYVLSYSRGFGLPIASVDDSMRQIGKVMELSLGYQGWVGAFQSMAKNYGVEVEDKKAAELAAAWREAHPKTRAYWYAVENTVKYAIKQKGKAFAVGVGQAKIVYKYAGSFLLCKLPSGHIMYYPQAYIGRQIEATLHNERADEIDKVSFIGRTDSEALAEMHKFAAKNKVKIVTVGKSEEAIIYKAFDSEKKTWGFTATYGGSLVENVCQAVSRDFLAEALLRLDERGYPIVIHVHDEPVAEVKNIESNKLSEFEDCMRELPSWALGFPLAAKGWEGFRYRK